MPLLKRVVRVFILGVAGILVAGCGGPYGWLPRSPIAAADLAGATALGIVQTFSSRAVDEEEETPHSRLYKLLADGEWAPVDFENESGRSVDWPVDLLHIFRLDEQFMVLVFGESWTNIDMPEEETWSDTFLLDAATGSMYYLNAIADTPQMHWPNDHDDPLSPVGGPELLFCSDSAGHVYYVGGPSSSNNFAREWTEVRQHRGVIRLTVNEESGSLTGEFITSDANSVERMAVNLAGDLVYSLGGEFAFRTAGGTLGFLSEFLDTDGGWECFRGGDGQIYVLDKYGMAETTYLRTLEFVSEEPRTDVALAFPDPLSNYVLSLITEEQLLFRSSAGILQYFYDGTTASVSFGSDLYGGRDIMKSDRYLYIVEPSIDFDTATSSIAVVVDLSEGTWVDFPLDSQRYRIEDIRDYAADPNAILAELTDILAGTVLTYALYPDGTQELIDETAEDALIITIEPL